VSRGRVDGVQWPQTLTNIDVNCRFISARKLAAPRHETTIVNSVVCGAAASPIPCIKAVSTRDELEDDCSGKERGRKKRDGHMVYHKCHAHTSVALTADIKSKAGDSSRDLGGLRYIVIKRTMPVSYFRMIHRRQTSPSQLRVINALQALRCAGAPAGPDCGMIALQRNRDAIFRSPTRSFRCITLASRRAIYRLADISSGKQRHVRAQLRGVLSAFYPHPRIIPRCLSLRPLVNGK